MWTKLDQVDEEILSGYIQNEHPQTAAIILQKINAFRAGKIIELLPSEFASDIITRMAKTEPIKDSILQNIENSLSRDIFSSLEQSRNQNININNVMAILKNTSHTKSTKILSHIKNKNPKISRNINSLIFKFDDLIFQKDETVQIIIENTDISIIAKALKGASSELSNKFFKNLDKISLKSLKEKLEKLGPIKLKEVDEAQTEIIMVIGQLKKNNIIKLKELD